MMKCNIKELKTRLCLIGISILLVGLSSSIVVYLTAEDASDNDLVYQYQSSKMYRHDLELTGGMVNVFADELLRWFGGLWHGKSLAFTLVCITLFLSSGFFLVAYHLRPGLSSAARIEEDRTGSKM